ncbi:MAG: hypothetical protein ACI4OR_03985 [Alphaproteobacteria bacterium]
MKTKHPYLKEILKTTAKVALIAGATAVLTPYAFGLAAGFFNMMVAGYAAGYAVAGIGTYQALKTAVKDTLQIRERVKKQQREEYVDEQLNEIKKELKKIQPQKMTLSKEKEIQPEVSPEKPKNKTKGIKGNPFLWKKAKDYDRAA